MIKELVKNIIKSARDGNSAAVKHGIHAALSEKIKVALAKKENEVAKGLFKGK